MPSVPYIFSSTPGGSSIPLAQLDADFAYLVNNTIQLSGLGLGVQYALTVGVNTPGGMLTYPSPVGPTGSVLTLDSSGVPYWTTNTSTSIVNDITTNATEYPLFASSTNVDATTIYTADTKYTFNPATGVLASPRPACTSGISLSAQAVTASYTIDAGYNGFSVGPIILSAGVVITVPAGAAWVVV